MTTHTLGKLAAFASLCAIFSIAGRLSNVSAQQVGPGGVPGAGGSGGGGVASVFGRTGAVVAATGDYTAAEVTNAADTTASNTFSALQHLTGGLDLTGGSSTTLLTTLSAGYFQLTPPGTNAWSIYASGSHQWFVSPPDTVLGWTALNDTTSAFPDTSLWRVAAGVVGLDTSTTSTPNTAGVLENGATIAGGTTFTATGCGTPTALVGGATAGSFVAQATSCTVVITMGALPQSPAHGWACFANDLTNPTDVLHQSATTTTTATFTGTVASGDAVNFACPQGY